MIHRGYYISVILFLSIITTVTAQSVTDSYLAYLNNNSPIANKIQPILNKIDSLEKESPIKALAVLDTSITILSNIHPTTTVSFLVKKKGYLHYKMGQLTKALATLQTAETAFKELEDIETLTTLKNKIGWIYMKEGKHKLARNQFETALKYAQQEKLVEKIGVNYNDIGVSFHYQKNYEKAIKNYLKSIKLRESIHSKKLVSSYNNIGVIYKLNQDTTNALKYYTKGKLLAETNLDSARIVSFNINLGRLFLVPNKVHLAISYFQTAQQIATAIGSQQRLTLSQYNLGEAYILQKKYDAAISLFEDCIERFDDLGEERDKIGTIYQLGKTHLYIEQYQKGLELMLQAESLAQETDIVFVDELDKIAEAYYSIKEPTLAYQYLKEHNHRKDSLESIKIKDRIGQLQAHYEGVFKAKEKEKEIALLNQEKNYIKKAFLYAFGFSLLILGLTFFLAILYRNKKRLNQELAKRNNTIHAQNGSLKELNKELVIAKESSEKSAKMKEEFLASMSHEIRTPMNAVIGMTDILIDEDPREDQIENLRILKFSAKNLLTLINDVLDFSKIEAGKISLEAIDFSIESLLQNVLETFKLSKSKINVDVILEKDLNLLKNKIKGDPTRLTQIFINLLGNALKFTEKGHVKLITRITDLSNKNVKIYFSVEDTGIGIPKDKFDHIFKSFTQAADSTTRLYGGTGLGLAITKSLVELHNSQIQLSSEVGIGSTFAFEAIFELGQPIIHTSKNKIKNNLSNKEGLENRSILLVEDNKINQLVGKKILNKWKVKLDIANDGVEALEYVQQNEYDIILMDIQMPRMNGYEATTAIRALKNEKANIPIIALTASDYSIAMNIKNSGMNGFLTKPFNPNELHRRICQLIEAQENTKKQTKESSVLPLEVL